MDRVTLAALALPSVVDGERYEGAMLQDHEYCIHCRKRDCETAPPANERQTCHKGLAYRNLRGRVLVYGVAVRDDPRATSQQLKALRRAGKESISAADFRSVCEAVDRMLEQEQVSVDHARSRALDQRRESGEYLGELVGALAPQIESALGQFHDYRALAGKVRMNIESYLEQLVPGVDLTTQLREAPHEIVAVYWSSLLMIDKLDTASFLLHPDRVLEVVDPPFRFHGLFTKYRKIYQRDFDAKGVRLIQEGESYATVESNSLAVSAFPLNLLDNALKYAPAGTDVFVRFREDEEAVEFSVESIGPLIEPDERRRIFEPFYRSKAAKRTSSEGLGFGLAVCRLVANRMGTEINVHQEIEASHRQGYATTFSVRIPRRRE